MSHLLRFALAAGLLAFAACGDDDPGPDAGGTGGGGSGGSSGGPSTLTWTEYMAASVTAFCDRSLECPFPNDDQLGERAILKTPERCRDYYSMAFARWINLTDLSDAVMAGRVLFDGQQAAACAAQDYGCELLPALDPAQACAHILSGTVAIGEACQRDEECAGMAYCASDTFSCPGVCTAKKAIGVACDAARECDNSDGYAECDRSVDPNVCVVRTIRRDAGLDEPCGVQTNGERVACEAALWCDAFSGVGICRAPIPVGAPNTDPDAPCEGLAFHDSVTDTCQEVIVSDQVGATCDAETGIPRHMCDPLANLICVNGACALAGDGLENSRCVSGALGLSSCQAGFYCDWQTNTCVRLKSVGDECGSSQECTVSCDFGTSTCTDHYCGI